MVAGRVDHGADVVEARRQLLDPLPDVGVILVERGVAEDIGRHEGAGRAELSAGMLEESRDRRQPRVLVVWPGVTCGAELAVGREPHVVELYLVETVADRLLRDRDVVGPDLFPERIDPGEVLAVDPGLARAPVGDRQVGPAGGEDVVLERDDARDRVDAARLQVDHQVVEVAHRGRPLRAYLERERHLGRVENPAAVSLHVDHERVQLGPLDQVEDATADPPVVDAEVGEVGRFDCLGPERDLERARRRFDRHLRVARHLHEQTAPRAQVFEGEAPVRARQDLDPVADDRGVCQRLPGLVYDAALDGCGPGSCITRRRREGRGGLDPGHDGGSFGRRGRGLGQQNSGWRGRRRRRLRGQAGLTTGRGVSSASCGLGMLRGLVGRGRDRRHQRLLRRDDCHGAGQAEPVRSEHGIPDQDGQAVQQDRVGSVQQVAAPGRHRDELHRRLL